jgi:hypothetical protein
VVLEDVSEVAKFDKKAADESPSKSKKCPMSEPAKHG